MKTFVPTWRFGVVGVVLAFAFVGVGVRVIYLQAFEAPRWQKAAEEIRVQEHTEPAQRGSIVDRRGHLLAVSRPVYDVGVDPQHFVQPPLRELYQLAAFLDMPVPELLAGAEETTFANGRKRRWKPLGTVTAETYGELMGLKVAGIRGDLRFERFYPGGQLAAHLVGYVNREGTAAMGVERALDWYLTGEAGLKITERAANRRELASHRRLRVPPTDGLSVELTIDATLQSLVESRLAALVEKYTPRAGVVIVTDARTGEILALANEPTFDLNEFWRPGQLDRQRNRAVTDPYEPGSTFKTVAFAAALQQGLVDEQTLIDCGIARAEWGGATVTLMPDHRNLGELPLHRAFALSSNRAAAQVAFVTGLEAFLETAAAMGFGEKPAWPLEGGHAGFLRQRAQMVPQDFTRMPAGYAVSATPLQIHYAMATIAAHGQHQRPHLIRGLRDAAGAQVMRFEPPAAEPALDAPIARRLARLLTEVVDDGTATNARIAGYAVAGKTGTAQSYLVDPETGRGAYTDQSHTASFSGFFPADDPALVITVVVDGANRLDPQTGDRLVAYGGAIAAPLFAEIGLAAAQYLDLPTDAERPAPPAPLFATVAP